MLKAVCIWFFVWHFWAPLAAKYESLSSMLYSSTLKLAAEVENSVGMGKK
jgi:hypothetical protein